MTRNSHAFIALWAAGVALILWSGTLVDGYQLHARQIPPSAPVPLAWRIDVYSSHVD